MHFSIKKSCKLKLKVLLWVVLFVGIVSFIGYRIDKLYSMRAASYAANEAVRIINQSIETVIEENPQYESFVQMLRNSENRVTAVEGNTILMNKFKSEITQHIQKTLNDAPPQNVYISIGNIFGISLLSNRGIRIPIRLAPVSDVRTDFYDDFQNSGINNIRHSMYIKVEIDLALLSYFSQNYQTVSTTVPLSETIITGEVPVYFSDSGYIGYVPENTQD